MYLLSNNTLQKHQPCGVPDLRLSTDGLKRGWVSTDTLVLTCASNTDFNLMNLFVVDILVWHKMDTVSIFLGEPFL